MHWTKKFARLGALALSAAVLAACGGSGPGNQTTKVTFSKIVNFGDSLSDVGSYKVGTVAALGGGKYTVNGPDGKNWTELLAAQLGVTAPCSAVTGLNGLAAYGFAVPRATHAGCTSYAQGGARVTNPVGPGNALLGGANAVLGQLTEPVVTQITNHLAASGGTFSGTEVVTVMAGGNDVFINLASIGEGFSPTDAVTQMGVAGAQLAGYVKAMILAKGAKYVVVVNLPDVSKTPFAYGLPAATQGLIQTMSKTFNDQLSAGLAGADVLLVDAFTAGTDIANNPAQFGVTNKDTPACDLTPAKNVLGSSLVCNAASNVITGDISHYYFADSVHPTPYGYKLLAQAVSLEMIRRGWL